MCLLGVAGLCSTIAQAEIAPLSTYGVPFDFTLRGTYGRKQAPYRAYYNLNGGYFQCSNAFLAFATFTHNAGTNNVRGMLAMTTMESTQYILNGGLLNAETVLLDPIGSACRFEHLGGSHRVNRLVLQTFPGRTFVQSIYRLEWGELEVRDVTLLDMVLFQHNGGTVRHTGLLTLAGGTWQAKPGTQVLGQLLVARSSYSSNSTLTLPASPCTVRFQASRAQRWETNASLFIRNWTGSLAGRGQHQVIFGRAPGGIRPEQLAQIRFVNPFGQLPGQYAATELANGEIVPAVEAEALPVVHIAKLSYALVLTWPVGYTLQSATNAVGPFEDVLKQFQTVPNDSGQAAVYFPLADRARLYRLRK